MVSVYQLTEMTDSRPEIEARPKSAEVCRTSPPSVMPGRTRWIHSSSSETVALRVVPPLCQQMSLKVGRDGSVGACSLRSTTTMSPESTHDLSIQDLLRVLNDKLSLEWNRIREASPSRVFSAAELKSEVGAHQPTVASTDMAVASDSSWIARKSGNQSMGYSWVRSSLTERVATGQQIAARDPLSYRRMFPGRVCPRYKVDHSIDSCVPILAPVHHLCPRELDVDLLLPNTANGVGPGAVQGGTSAPPDLLALCQPVHIS